MWLKVAKTKFRRFNKILSYENILNIQRLKESYLSPNLHKQKILLPCMQVWLDFQTTQPKISNSIKSTKNLKKSMTRTSKFKRKTYRWGIKWHSLLTTIWIWKLKLQLQEWIAAAQTLDNRVELTTARFKILWIYRYHTRTLIYRISWDQK